MPYFCWREGEGGGWTRVPFAWQRQMLTMDGEARRRAALDEQTQQQHRFAFYHCEPQIRFYSVSLMSGTTITHRRLEFVAGELAQVVVAAAAPPPPPDEQKKA